MYDKRLEIYVVLPLCWRNRSRPANIYGTRLALADIVDLGGCITPRLTGIVEEARCAFGHGGTFE